MLQISTASNVTPGTGLEIKNNNSWVSANTLVRAHSSVCFAQRLISGYTAAEACVTETHQCLLASAQHIVDLRSLQHWLTESACDLQHLATQRGRWPPTLSARAPYTFVSLGQIISRSPWFPSSKVYHSLSCRFINHVFPYSDVLTSRALLAWRDVSIGIISSRFSYVIVGSVLYSFFGSMIIYWTMEYFILCHILLVLSSVDENLAVLNIAGNAHIHVALWTLVLIFLGIHVEAELLICNSTHSLWKEEVPF